MNFKNKLIDKVLNPATSNKFTNATATILKFDSESNRADIFVKGSSGIENLVLNEVPIQIVSLGVRTPNLKEGDRVYVQFNNNTIHQPKIIGYADEKFYANTREIQRHSRKGECICNIKKITGDVKPSCKSWVEEGNNTNYKYSKYKTEAPLKDIQKLISSKGYFKNDEIALYNPNNTSIVKIKDNGDIDIFVSTNIGIRVSKEKKEIEFFGDLVSNSNFWTIKSNCINVESKEININSNKINIKGEVNYE